jgi:hypothetical protein
LEDAEIREGLVGTGDVWFANDFEQRCSGAIEIDAGRVLHMEALGDIFLEMNSHETDLLVLRRDRFLGIFWVGQIVQGNDSAEAKRQIVLADLVILGHVGIKVVFAVEFADFGNLATKHESGQRGETQSLLVHDGKGAGKAETDRTEIGVRFSAMFHGAAAKHFRSRLQLHVNFQTNSGDVFRHEFTGVSLATVTEKVVEVPARISMRRKGRLF